MAQIDIGVNYGMVGNNLPSPATVVQLYKRCNIGKMRLFDPNPDVLNAPRGSGIDVTLGIKDQNLPPIASSADAAKTWFHTNVQPYVSDINFQYITAGRREQCGCGGFESGWLSARNRGFTTPQLAQTYNRNFVKKFLAKQATPKRPDHYLEGFIFAMFNEDQKPQGVEQNWGLFYPDGTPVYPVFS
ncbi:hypothetical protein NL676_029538 [Syzygium grande]|nr:hypothetical protein NL676_029538 [Syzygium grande]